jgi:hypothetical protein
MIPFILKSTAKSKGYTLGLCRILTVLCEMAQEMTHPKRLVGTSQNDSVHSKNSRHYKDEAIDIRSKSFKTLTSKIRFRDRLRLKLGQMFYVELEDIGTKNEHFHLQIRKGRSYP